MTFKSILAVIVISILAGIGIYYFTSSPQTKLVKSSTPQEVPSMSEAISTPTPLPSQTPINKDTDLAAEIAQQASPDFNPDYKKLKEEVNSSF